MTHPIIKNIFVSVATLAVLIFSFSVFWYVASFNNFKEPTRTFSVSGEGKVFAVPDVAFFTFSLITEGGKELGSLQEQNSKKANRVISFLKEKGVKAEDIQTRSYNIEPRYQYFSCEKGPCLPPEIVGYRVIQNVGVKVRDFSKTGDLLAGLVENGANSVSNLSFEIDDLAKVQNEAREKAIKQAQTKALAIARAAGFKLGKLISVNEGYSSPPVPLYERSTTLESLPSMPKEAPTIEPGSQEVRIQVNLTYEIK
jgi:uncharacterized protein YggE